MIHALVGLLLAIPVMLIVAALHLLGRDALADELEDWWLHW